MNFVNRSRSKDKRNRWRYQAIDLLISSAFAFLIPTGLGKSTYLFIDHQSFQFHFALSYLTLDLIHVKSAPEESPKSAFKDI
jgi:hypothetical protein